MSTSTTTNLSLIKEGGDEYIKTHRAHANANLDAVDTAIGNINSAVTALQNAITNANALLGTLGVDGNGDPLISAASARATLDAAQDDTSGTTLAAAASNISTLLATTGIASTPSGSTLQGQIDTLQDSVSAINYTEARAITTTIADTGMDIVVQPYTAISVQIRQQFSHAAPTDIRVRNGSTYISIGTNSTCWLHFFNNSSSVKALDVYASAEANATNDIIVTGFSIKLKAS